ncbi:MAG: hypothetical protein Q4C95_09030 [Planctomycetia bacterium]|nr:hypothetical protein [Planctomycetia bacterium]
MKKNIFCLGIMLLVLVVMSGCSNKCKVSGKVTFPDGTPLKVGMIIFEDGVSQARGNIDENGNYKVSSEGKNDGIKRGTYNVYITQANGFDTSGIESVESKEGQTNVSMQVAPLVNFIDSKFESPTTSGLKVEVKGKTVYDITVYKPGEVPAESAAAPEQ